MHNSYEVLFRQIKVVHQSPVEVNKNANVGYSQDQGLLLVSGLGFLLEQSCFA